MGSTPTRHRKPFIQPRLTRYGMIEKITMSSVVVNNAGTFIVLNKTGLGLSNW